MQEIMLEIDQNMTQVERIIDFLSEQTGTAESDWNIISQNNTELFFFNSQIKTEAQIIINSETSYDFFIRSVSIH